MDPVFSEYTKSPASRSFPSPVPPTPSHTSGGS